MVEVEVRRTVEQSDFPRSQNDRGTSLLNPALTIQLQVHVETFVRRRRDFRPPPMNGMAQRLDTVQHAAAELVRNNACLKGSTPLAIQFRTQRHERGADRIAIVVEGLPLSKITGIPGLRAGSPMRVGPDFVSLVH